MRTKNSSAEPASVNLASAAQALSLHDWSCTSLGPADRWPQSLQIAACLCLESPSLLSVFWGDEFGFIYSDAWKAFIEEPSSSAQGLPAAGIFGECWSELADACRQVRESAQAVSISRQQLISPACPQGCYLNHSLTPLRNESGEVQGVFAVTTKSADQTMDEISYRILLNAAAAGISETDINGIYTYVNDRYCDMVGRSRDQLIGRMTFTEVTHPEDVPLNIRLVEAMLATGEPFGIEKRFLRPDGSVMWASTYVSCVGLPSDRHGRWIAASIDITPKKRAEDAVRQSDERKSFLLQLGDRLRPLRDPLEVMDSAAAMLGEYLHVNRVSYGELFPDGRVVAGRSYANGVASLPERLHLAKMAPAVYQSFLQNRTSVARDLYEDKSLTTEQRTGWDSVQVRAHVSVPLSKNGRLVAALGVHQAQPRQWTETEISLIEETAERTWAAVEQARAEAALRKSERRLSAIFAQAAAGLSEMRLDGQFRHVNDELCRLLGRTREQLTQMNAKDVLHPDDLKQSLTALTQLVEGGESVTLDVRCLRPDGSTVFVSTALSRFDDEYGRARAVLGVIVDLSERKRAEAALAEELADNRRLQEISTRLIPADDAGYLFEELITAAVDIMRADQGIIQLLEPGRELQILAAKGIDASQLYQFEHMSSVPGTVCAAALQQKKRVIISDYSSSPKFSSTDTAQAHIRNGVMATQSTPLISRSGRVLGIVSTYWKNVHQPSERQLRLLDILARQAADLVERHQSEVALRQSEERYRTLFSSIDEGFCVVEIFFDDQGRPLDYGFVEVNPAFEKHTGLVDVIGKRMKQISPSYEDHWYQTYGQVALTGEPRRFINEARSLGRWFDVYAFRFGDAESRRVAVIFNDITQRIKVEDELKQADRRKNEFLAMLAHELRNPLAPIRTGLEVLRLSQGQKETTEHMLELMGRQMQQMVRLVDDLLDISRITQGKLQIRRELCDLERILGSAIDSSRPFIGISGVSLNVEILPEALTVFVDPARLAQVLSNLLNNAAKYTDAGGEIWLTATRCDSDLTLIVRDTGTGIPEGMLKTVFDPFTQVEHALDRSRGGLGVGLSLVKTLVELHGGSVSAYSEGRDKGAKFIIQLPDVIKDKNADATPPMLLQHIEPVPRKILVVDDNIDAASALAMMLEMVGHKVRIAHDGIQGMTAAEEFQPHLVLLDLGMPELDGYETARLIRAQPWGKTMTIAALTGWGQEDDRRRTREAGFDYHLVKPIEREVLFKVLDALPAKR